MNINKKLVILSEQLEAHDFPLDPLTKKIFIKIAKRGEHDNRADIDYLRQVLSKELGVPVEIPFSLMSGLPGICHRGDWQISATLAAGSFFDGNGRVKTWRLINLEPGDRSEFNVGLAIDIGTTTVVAYLVDLVSGKTICKASDYNSQIQLGEDILSRIMAARDGAGLETLQRLIVSTLNGLIKEVCVLSSIESKDISAVSFGANTTMIHLLLGLDPASICRAPYIPVVNNPEIFQAKEIGLDVNPLAPIYCLPSVGSYIGGDIIAGILVSGMHQQEEISLFVDIGTNGEIVIGNEEWLVACAGAAGPALEGGVSECGMRAEQGAVDSVVIKSNHVVGYTTINDLPPQGICGSGLIDSLAELFLNGIIDRAAQFSDGRERFVIVPAGESSEGKEIFISQRDIANLMRTKGAVNAALEVLIESVGCRWEDIGKFYAAGAFGQYLHLESAVTVGLYPDLPRERMIRLGNSSGEGARQVLLSNAKRREGEEIAAKITYFEMNANSTFMDKYAGSKFLPHTNLEIFPSVKEKLAAHRSLRRMEVAEVKDFYRYIKQDFPKGEYPPYGVLLQQLQRGIQEGIVFKDQRQDLAYSIISSNNTNRYVLVSLLAVLQEQRCKGVGSNFLKALIGKYQDQKGMIVEVERPEISLRSKKSDAQRRRIEFYENAGFYLIPYINYSIWDIPMHLMALPILASQSTINEEIEGIMTEIYEKLLTPRFSHKMIISRI